MARDKMHEMYKAELRRDKFANLPKWRKGIEYAKEVGNLGRALKATLDLSAVLRQGGFLAFGHPVRAAKAITPMLRAFSSEAKAHQINSEIQSRPNAPLYKASKLYFADQNAPLSAREESFASRLASKIPLVAGSERAYNTFLNKLRADSFDAMSTSLSRHGISTVEESRTIANYINVATGRGNVGAAGEALGQVFFSPRYWASRLQLLGGQPLYGGSAVTRKLIAKDYAHFLIGLGVVYALGQAAGGDVEKDSRSSDFGKIRFGKTRIDPLTGMGQHFVFLRRLYSGQSKSTMTGKIADLRGEDRKYGKPDVEKTVSRYVRGKLAPVPSSVLNYVAGEDSVGKKVTAASAAGDFFTPLVANDIYTSLKEEGIEKGAAMSLLALFGAGVQTYDDEDRASKPKKVSHGRSLGPGSGK